MLLLLPSLLRFCLDLLACLSVQLLGIGGIFCLRSLEQGKLVKIWVGHRGEPGDLIWIQILDIFHFI